MGCRTACQRDSLEELVDGRRTVHVACSCSEAHTAGSIADSFWLEVSLGRTTSPSYWRLREAEACRMFTSKGFQSDPVGEETKHTLEIVSTSTRRQIGQLRVNDEIPLSLLSLYSFLQLLDTRHTMTAVYTTTGTVSNPLDLDAQPKGAFETVDLGASANSTSRASGASGSKRVIRPKPKVTLTSLTPNNVSPPLLN